MYRYGRGYSVLVVENEGIVAKDICMRLGNLGYQVVGTESYAERAVESCRAIRPDLVLMDIELNGRMDGIEAAGLIRANPGTPVIYLTANATDDVMQRAKLTEPYGYLIKPFESFELHSAIQMAMHKFAIEDEVRKTRDQYQTFLESVMAIPWEYSTRLDRFTYVGPQSMKVLGYAPHEWKGMAFWASMIHEDDRDQAVSFCMAQTEAGLDHDFEYRVRTARGEVKWLRDVVSVVRGDGQDGGGVTLVGFMQDVTGRKRAEHERERLITELQDALASIKTLKGLLPICAWCKKIRDDRGYWTQVETYVKEHSGAEFTHGICPECIEKMDMELDRERQTGSGGQDHQ